MVYPQRAAEERTYAGDLYPAMAVLLIGRVARVICFNKSEAQPRWVVIHLQYVILHLFSVVTSREPSGDIAKRRLFSQALYHISRIKSSLKIS